MINAVAQFANRDHSESEMVVVAIMSHGGMGGQIQVKVKLSIRTKNVNEFVKISKYPTC
jgi:hypothetical protein